MKLTLVIIFMGVTHIQAMYKTTTLENPVLPISLGTAYMTNQHNTAYYHINTTIILQSIRKLESVLTKLTQILNDTTWSNHFSTLFQTNIETSKSQIKLMKQTIKTLNNKRNKRGLLNFMGTAQKWLFGTLDAEDGARYDSYIRTLNENQLTLENNLKSQSQVLKQVTKTYHDQFINIETNQKVITDRIKNISIDNENIHAMLDLNLILNNINMESNKIKDLIDHVQLAINFAQLGIMHYTILQHNELNQILANIPKNQQIPFDNKIKYYETMITQVRIQKELIIFVIYTPMIDPRPFLLYKIYPIPIQDLTIKNKYPYLILTTESYYNSYVECPKVEDVYLCDSETMKQEDSCIYDLITERQQQCTFLKIQYDDSTVRQLPNGQLLIIPKKSLTMVLNCDKKNYMDLITYPTLVNLEECQATIKNQTYLKVNENFNFELQIPKIEIPELPENTTILKLKEIDHEALQEAINDASNLQVQPLNNLAYITNNLSTYIIIMLIIIIIILILSMYLYRKCKQRKITTNVEIELSDLSKHQQSQFATT